MTEIVESPKRIYLQPATRDYRDGWTWCWHDIDDDDIEYVRADEVERLRDALEMIAERFPAGTYQDAHARHLQGIARRALESTV